MLRSSVAEAVAARSSRCATPPSPSWLCWGKITNFVAERGMQTVVMQLESASSTAAANVLSTSVKRFSDPADFFEALNLFIMFCTALGLATAVVVTEFLEYTVFDTIRMRGKTWQVAHELFLVMLRRIEDSGGKLNMVNCINDTHLNTVVEEAEVSAKRHRQVGLEQGSRRRLQGHRGH